MSFEPGAGRGFSSAPILRPMEIGDLLDEAFDLYRHNFRLLFSVAALLTGPATVLMLVAPDDSASTAWVSGVYLLATLVTACALTRALMDRVLLRPARVFGAFRAIAVRWLRLLAAVVIFYLAAGIGLLLLVVPGLIVLLWGLLLTPVVVVENRGGVGAFQRTRRLSAGGLGRLVILAMGLLLILLVFLFLLFFVVGIIAMIVSPEEPASGGGEEEDVAPEIGLILGGLAALLLLFQAVWSPLVAGSCLLAYLDFRVRREAYDLELLTTSVEARAKAAVAGPVAAVGPASGYPTRFRP